MQERGARSGASVRRDQTDGVADGGHPLFSLFATFSTTFSEHVLYIGRIFDQLMSALPRFGEVLRDQPKQFFLGMAVPESTCSVGGGYFFALCFVGEQANQGEYVTRVRVFRLLQRGGVGDDAHHFLFELLSLIEDADRVAIALRHLATVDSGDNGHFVQDVRLRDRQDRFAVSEPIIEPDGQVAADLKILLLVRSDRYLRSSINEDVGRLQDGVIEEAGIGAQSLGNLVLVGHSFLQLGYGSQRVENPGQLIDLGDVTLQKEIGLLRVETEGEVVECYIERILAQRLSIVQRRQRMVIDDEEVGLECIMQRNVLTDGTEVIAQMQGPGWLDTGDDDRGEGCVGICRSVTHEFGSWTLDRVLPGRLVYVQSKPFCSDASGPLEDTIEGVRSS